MPKVTISEEERKNRILRGSIKNAEELWDMNPETISKLTGIPRSTLYAKIRDPDKFTVRELRLVFSTLKYSVGEKERLGREAL